MTPTSLTTHLTLYSLYLKAFKSGLKTQHEVTQLQNSPCGVTNAASQFAYCFCEEKVHTFKRVCVYQKIRQVLRHNTTLKGQLSLSYTHPVTV